MDYISIILPIFNGQKTLSKCLDSILNQTFKDFEVIAVNDGSTDDTMKILEEYALKDERIKPFNRVHSGVSSARNFALANKIGNYVKFVDADDTMESNALDKLYKTIKRTNSDVVVCGFSHLFFTSYLKPATYNLRNKDILYKYCQDFFTSSMLWNKLYKASALTEKFRENVSLTEDELFNFENLKNFNKVTVISDVLYHYSCEDPKKKRTENSSLINKIAKDGNLWETKQGHWFKCDNLFPYRLEVAEKNFGKKYEKLAYLRAFDFYFWELIVFTSLGFDNYGLCRETSVIFSEKHFLDSLNFKRSYGVKFRRPSENRIMFFISDWRKIFDLINNGERKLNYFKAFVTLFAKYFIVETDELDLNDYLAECKYELDNNITYEAICVNYLKAKDHKTAYGGEEYDQERDYSRI